MQFLNVRSASPYRITVTTDVAPDTVAADYAITRFDNASTSCTVTNAFVVAPNVVELSVGGEALIDGVQYVISNPSQPGSPSALVTYRQSLAQSQVPVVPAEDPEAEAFGVDIDWFADALTPSGDTPTVRGRQCLTNDLAVIAMVQRGELFHRPDAGAGLKLNVNGPMSQRGVELVLGSVTREWYKDARVRQNGVTTRAEISASTGQLTVFGTVLPVAVDDPTLVKLPGGGT